MLIEAFTRTCYFGNFVTLFSADFLLAPRIEVGSAPKLALTDGMKEVVAIATVEAVARINKRIRNKLKIVRK